MFKILKDFFDFCGEKDRKRFYASIVLSLLQAVFEALKIPAIACMVKALIDDKVTADTCLICLGIMLVSIIGAGSFKAKATMLQTEGGYNTCAEKRMQLAEHLRYRRCEKQHYLPRGRQQERQSEQLFDKFVERYDDDEPKHSTRKTA